MVALKEPPSDMTPAVGQDTVAALARIFGPKGLPTLPAEPQPALPLITADSSIAVKIALSKDRQVESDPGASLLTVPYHFLEESPCFPGPRGAQPIALNRTAILLVDERSSLRKVLPDTEKDRKAVKAAIEKGHGKPPQERRRRRQSRVMSRTPSTKPKTRIRTI